MLAEISKAYLDGRLMLLLGAGASRTSFDHSGRPLPLAHELAEELASLCGFPYDGEELGEVYSAVNDTDAAGLEFFFRRRLTNCRPSTELLSLISYRWSRIYTLNIDDSLEVAARTTRTQRLAVFGRLDSIADLDPVFDELQIVKLNGSADRLGDGLIFSPQEYGAGSSRVPPWYRELSQNYTSNIFVFIGTSLKEPLLQHVMADMREGARRSPQRGYLISPHATSIQTRHLASLNIAHVPGTIADFVTFLSTAVGTPPTGWELAVAKRPELRNLPTSLTVKQQRALNSVIAVGADTLPRSVATTAGSIRAFYRGFKPTWTDILDGVPAKLAAFDEFLDFILNQDIQGKLTGLLGPAGSGKTTMLMSVALALSARTNNPVYFLREPVDDVGDILLTLEQINNGPFYLFIDRLDIVARDVITAYDGGNIKRGGVIFAERQNLWRRRLQEICEKYAPRTYAINRIRKSDVDPILEKLEEFGPWTRLEGMTISDRRKELFAKSNRQLLIGLLETTNGVGFTQIIRRDYANVGLEQHEKMLVIVGLATIHRTAMPIGLCGRALQYAGIDADVSVLTREMEGVIEVSDGRLLARHPVYIRELFERIVNPETIRHCVVAVLHSFQDFEAPVIRHCNRIEGFIFKSIINHRFLRRMMRDDEDRVRSIYAEFETIYHVDGLYWLQYGLALRDFGRHEEALDMFRTARLAYTSPQIEHAFAQQLLIIAEQAPNWEIAEPLVQEAVENFGNQKQETWETDTYPIVSVAEGHVSVFVRFRSETEARKLARDYAREVQRLRSRVPSQRLDAAAVNLITYATTGIWKGSRGDGKKDWEN